MFFPCQVVTLFCSQHPNKNPIKNLWLFHKKEHHQEGQKLHNNPKNTTQSMKIAKTKGKTRMECEKERVWSTNHTELVERVVVEVDELGVPGGE